MREFREIEYEKREKEWKVISAGRMVNVPRIWLKTIRGGRTSNNKDDILITDIRQVGRVCVCECHSTV